MGAEKNLCDFDKGLAEAAQLFVDVDGNRQQIMFQFAPRVLTDNNNSNWLEVDVWSIEPLRIHTGSQGRKLSVEWEYIGTGSSDYSPKRISEYIRMLKRYFFEFKREYYPVVWMNQGGAADGGEEGEEEEEAYLVHAGFGADDLSSLVRRKVWVPRGVGRLVAVMGREGRFCGGAKGRNRAWTVRERRVLGALQHLGVLIRCEEGGEEGGRGR